MGEEKMMFDWLFEENNKAMFECIQTLSEHQKTLTGNLKSAFELITILSHNVSEQQKIIVDQEKRIRMLEYESVIKNSSSQETRLN